MTWRLRRVTQCKKCPWLIGTDPRTIPNGYSESRHRLLKGTIVGGLESLSSSKAMACHEMHNAHCIGWLVNQVGPGNNIGLRIRMFSCENAHKIRLRGEQHATFEDTLP